MFPMQSIGLVRSPYTETAQIPRGPAAQHHAEGVLEILPEFEEGLTDIEGFSHLFVLWVFDRAAGYDLLVTRRRRPARTACSRRGRRGGRTPSASRWCNCSAGRGRACTSAALICWMARRSWTSSRTSPACRRST
jgi:hypothetical protein